MLKKNGFTLIEIVVVLTAIGILSALAWPNYVAIKEKTLNREARAVLLLLHTAEKNYRMEHGKYYPETTTVSAIPEINQNLKLSIPLATNWTFTLDTTTSGSEFVQAARSGSDSRVWKSYLPDEFELSCSGGSYCS
ncbi:MAG: type II secretion system protein [Candidatus Omnitrophica bacterium]|jgi:prepilin-type N-terminal cleavage/methylation domain-containing protein|nr:type II secretion system GspH family protein [Candidatus Omnitrophota bacterium]MDD3274948.1 type II secretion system protein [Candidatus Omnitrophota bacterium]MDD5078478.1 type II secretion system protein [Candidatus Omnitrophota bacterium]MDD5724907.1 type II secretion system protein [Candidatus Omnitrophota bacterium]